MKKLLKLLFSKSAIPSAVTTEATKRKIRVLPPMVLHNETILTTKQFSDYTKLDN
jgi:hypothetical protein